MHRLYAVHVAMGYYRPIESFNTGKLGEHAEREYFKEQSNEG